MIYFDGIVTSITTFTLLPTLSRKEDIKKINKNIIK